MCSLKTPENIICSKRNLLGQGTKGVAEGFGGKVKESLEEDVDLQRVEAFAFIWQKKTENEESVLKFTPVILTVMLVKICHAHKQIILWAVAATTT